MHLLRSINTPMTNLEVDRRDSLAALTVTPHPETSRTTQPRTLTHTQERFHPRRPTTDDRRRPDSSQILPHPSTPAHNPADCQTMEQRMRYRHSLYVLAEDRDMKPSVVAATISSTLYARRFGPYFVEPIVAGLEESKDGDFKVVLSGMDLIGCALGPRSLPDLARPSHSRSPQRPRQHHRLHGRRHELRQPLRDLRDAVLARHGARAGLALGRRPRCDGRMGSGIVHIMTPDKIITRKLKGRRD